MLKIYGIANSKHSEPEELKELIGKIARVHGIIYKIRDMSGFSFILLRTKRDLLQCVYSEEYSEFDINEIKENMSVCIIGEVVAEERSPLGYEVRIKNIEILSIPKEEMPIVINKKNVAASINVLLDYRPITLRNIKERAIFKIQEGICAGFREFLLNNNFTEIHTPKIVFSGAEGGANIFKLDYFDKKAFLAQSPQFYKQMMVGVHERVFEIAPVFRAEKHNTTRHLNEYTSVDLEMGFIKNFYEIMEMETSMIREMLLYLKGKYKHELDLLEVRIPEIKDIPAIRFDEAKELIARTFNREITDFEDFEPEEERLLCQIIKKQTGSELVFVTHYKSSKRPFYTMDTADELKYTDSFDLLFRGVEVTTGGQRIHDYDEQVKKMKDRDMDPELFNSYLMAHKYGLPPHGGLGLGLERFTARLLELPNVRYATLFPRDIDRLEP